ncbi:MAG TPA: hypothetical protein VLA28_06390, partial [Afifellaceae bacterium]|nr:hypothetical protein [Afifellaceae bacterium]
MRQTAAGPVPQSIPRFCPNSSAEQTWHYPHAGKRGVSGALAARAERQGRWRVAFAMAGFGLLYAALAARLVMLGVTGDGGAALHLSPADLVAAARPDIVDRNGEILATDIKTASLYGEP